METLPAQTITSNAGYHQQAYEKCISDIRRATKEIEEAYKHLSEANSDDAGKIPVLQVVLQCSAVPDMLGQQLKMIDVLEMRYGEQLQSRCLEEVKEMASLSSFIRDWLSNAISDRTCSDVAAKGQLVDNIFKSAARLNLLQQRISGKMMKVKPV